MIKPKYNFDLLMLVSKPFLVSLSKTTRSSIKPKPLVHKWPGIKRQRACGAYWYSGLLGIVKSVYCRDFSSRGIC